MGQKINKMPSFPFWRSLIACPFLIQGSINIKNWQLNFLYGGVGGGGGGSSKYKHKIKELEIWTVLVADEIDGDWSF